MAEASKKFSVSKWLKWVLGAVLVFALWGVFISKKAPEVATTQTVATETVGVKQAVPTPVAPACGVDHKSEPLTIGSKSTIWVPGGCQAHLNPMPESKAYTLGCVDMQNASHDTYDDASCGEYTALTVVPIDAGAKTLKSVEYWFTPIVR